MRGEACYSEGRPGRKCKGHAVCLHEGLVNEMDLRVVSKAASSSKQVGLVDAWIFVTKLKYKQFKHFQVTNEKGMPITEVQQGAH